MVKVIFHTHDSTSFEVEAAPGTTLMQAARDRDVPGIVAECGGACACATCHVHVDEAWLSRLDGPDQMERDMLEFAWEPSGASRLSCQITLRNEFDGLTVRIPERQT